MIVKLVEVNQYQDNSHTPRHYNDIKKLVIAKGSYVWNDEGTINYFRVIASRGRSLNIYLCRNNYGFAGYSSGLLFKINDKNELNDLSKFKDKILSKLSKELGEVKEITWYNESLNYLEDIYDNSTESQVSLKVRFDLGDSGKYSAGDSYREEVDKKREENERYISRVLKSSGIRATVNEDSTRLFHIDDYLIVAYNTDESTLKNVLEKNFDVIKYLKPNNY